jgi:hypothetical protein
MNRAELVSWFLGIFVLALTGIWIGWRNRGRRQSDIAALPVIPADLGADLVPPISGLYVGTTMSGQWQNRLVVHTLGLRASCIARLTTAGVVIQRKGTRAIFIPADRLIDARLEPALAGKVVGQGGLLVLRWRHSDVDLDTGLRADDKRLYPAWAHAINPEELLDDERETNQG